METPITILSIDGGGIRGLIPATFLAYLEKNVGRKTADVVDIVAGTSTGGILACGLSVPDPDSPDRPKYDAEDTAEIYKTEGSRIFDRSAMKAVSSLGQLVDEKYPTDGLRRVLREFVGDTPLSGALSEVIVPVYELTRRVPMTFSRSVAKHNKRMDLPLWEVALATSVAPTYFAPWETAAGEDTGPLSFVDGGLYAANPAMVAATHALSFEGVCAGDVRILSLGTGYHRDGIEPAEAEGWGLAGWARPLLMSAMEGSAQQAHRQCSMLFDQYARFDVELDPSHLAMDDASPENLQALESAAERMIDEQRDKFRAVVDALR